MRSSARWRLSLQKPGSWALLFREGRSHGRRLLLDCGRLHATRCLSCRWACHLLRRRARQQLAGVRQLQPQVGRALGAVLLAKASRRVAPWHSACLLVAVAHPAPRVAC